jgi:hypothetical protein
MNEANYASLTAGLLARKGQARPAMRPQGYGFASDDDLGWNDMGGDMLTAEQRAALMPAQPMHFQPRPAVDFDHSVPSPVAAQQQAIADEFAAAAAAVVPETVEVQETPVVSPAPVTAAIPSISMTPAQPVHRPRAAAGSKAKAAFTLRLDPERHMKLRLACVYAHQSAQQLVTAALDEYLSTHFPDALKDMRKSAAN